MRADFWRYLALYVHGGLYADADTEPKEPIETWLPPACELFLLKEPAYGKASRYMAQWLIYAKPRSPLLLDVINLIVSRVTADGGVLPSTRACNQSKTALEGHTRTTFVHYYTGPAVWTQAVVDRFLSPAARSPQGTWCNLQEDAKRLWRDREELSSQHGLCIADQQMSFCPTCSTEDGHRFASRQFYTKVKMGNAGDKGWKREVYRVADTTCRATP